MADHAASSRVHAMSLRQALARFHENGVITLEALERGGAGGPAACDRAMVALGFDSLQGLWHRYDVAAGTRVVGEILARSDIWCDADLDTATAAALATRVAALAPDATECWSNGQWFEAQGKFSARASRRSAARRRRVSSMQDLGVVFVAPRAVVVFWYEE